MRKRLWKKAKIWNIVVRFKDVVPTNANHPVGSTCHVILEHFSQPSFFPTVDLIDIIRFSYIAERMPLDIVINCSNAFCSIWIGFMEVAHKGLCICNIFLWLPSSLFIRISFPLHQILEFPTMHSRVQNFFHNIFLLFINHHWGWWKFYSLARYVFLYIGSELDSIEDRVDLPGGGKFKFICTMSNFLCYNKGAKTFII